MEKEDDMTSRVQRGLQALQALALSCAVVAGVLVAGQAVALAAPATVDGATSASAAASCWEVKQNVPMARSGIYWLLTPALQAPQQFYCDQETDGGGWVLVARGREGWTQNYQGTGSPTAIREFPAGQSAFRAAQLPAKTVDALLNGERVDQLADGVRLRRATNIAGTTWQESTFKYSKRDRWVWTPSGKHPLRSYAFNAVPGSGGDTSYFGSDDSFNRIDTRHYVNGIFRAAGWAFGPAVKGSSDAGSYLWTGNTAEGSARPFTQMFLRPTLLQADLEYPAVADAGTAVQEQRVLPQSGAEQTVWGVTGLANSRATELDAEVQGFAQVGRTVFPAGNFRYVQRGPNGEDRVEQSYVAGFDVDSGEFLPDFRPVLNGQVKAVAALPNGLLVIAGEFTQVNGTPAAGVAALDAVTGALSTSWTVNMENRLTSGSLSVRSLSIEGDYLYLGGAFTHLRGGSDANPTYARGAARVRLTDGTPDRNWNPAFNGTVVSIDAADDQRMYAAGYFTLSNGAKAHKVAAVTAGSAQPASLAAAWPFTGSSTDGKDYQQTIRKVADTVWVGGAQHSLSSYNASSFARTSGNITLDGGDFQASETSNGTLYAGCHCNDWSYSNAFTWPGVGSNWAQADKIGFVGAWDAATASFLPDFAPQLRARRGGGAWGIFADSNGRLWVGGDFVSSINNSGQNQWSGGFVRFAPRDSTAPATPTGAEAKGIDGGDLLSWTGAEVGTTYEVIRGDRVVDVTTETSVALPAAAEGTKYFVRAADVAGNRSASTPAFTAAVEAEPEPGQTPDPATELVANGAEWKYRFENSAPNAQWNQAGFDDAAWASGAAPLGFGHSSIATALVSSGTKPLTSYYRRSFEVPDATTIKDLTLTSRADDGLVVYLNGVEVTRANMGTGTPAFNTYASAAPRTVSAPAVSVVVPGAALVTGSNVLAVEVHSNYRSTPDSSMDLRAVATLGSSVQPPVVTDPGDASEPGAAQPEQLVARGSSWLYRFDNSAPATEWAVPEFDDSGWTEGTAPLGFGHSSVVTSLVFNGTKPLTSYFRRSFDVADPARVQDFTITTRADDGIVVYVNGVEATRSNMPLGAPAFNTYATSAPTTGSAPAVTVVVPGTALSTGKNVIAVEVHSNYRSTGNTSMELDAVATLAAAEPGKE